MILADNTSDANVIKAVAQKLIKCVIDVKLFCESSSIFKNVTENNIDVSSTRVDSQMKIPYVCVIIDQLRLCTSGFYPKKKPA